MKLHRNTWALIAIAVFAAGGLMAWTTFKASQPTPPSWQLRPDDPQRVAAGAKIYAAQGAACHGSQLEGQADWRVRDANGMLPAPPHDASGHTWHHDDKTLFDLTKLGVAAAIGDPSYPSSMPAFKAVLSDDDIVDVLSWIKAQWPEDVRRSNDDVNASKNPLK